MVERYVFIRKNSPKAFPRQVATPQRRIVRNWAELKRFHDNYFRQTDLYTTVYGYDQTTEHGYNVKEHTANIDKLFFDLDPEQKPEQCLENVKRLHRFLLKKDLKHNIVFSGGGFHIYVYTSTDTLMSPRGALREAAYWAVDEANLEEEFIDTSVFGDVSQITRIPNSYNHKEHRQRWCIPLGERHMDMSYEEIADCADSPNMDYSTWGSKKLDLVHFDELVQNGGSSRVGSGNSASFHREDLETIDLDEVEGMNVESIDLPRCLKRIAEKGKQGEHVGFRERYILIVWLRDMGIAIDDAKEFLAEHLQGTKPSRPNETDYRHMINEVNHLKYGQLSDIYDKRETRHFPTHETLIQEGFCKHEWGECQRLYKGRGTENGTNPREIYKELKKN